MIYYKTLDYLSVRTEPTTAAERLGIIRPNMVVYGLDESVEDASGIIWNKVYAPLLSGFWREGYVAESYNTNDLLRPFVPHVQLGSPFPHGCSVTQLFAENPSSYSWLDMVGHNGIDLSGGFRSVVHAIAFGVVMLGQDAGYGKYVRIEGESLITVYAHLDEHRIAHGVYAQAGQVIGTQGNTGNSSATHLHIDIRKKSDMAENGFKGRVDPFPYLDRSRFLFPAYCKLLQWK